MSRVASRGIAAAIGALRQGHRIGDALANAIVQAVGTAALPDLARIPARS